jgi:hypothetical protein
MSIARGLVCDHQFQAFVDKQFQVRGYQRVDFEFESESKSEKVLNQKEDFEEDHRLFENLILEGNYLEFKPLKTKNRKLSLPQNQKIMTEKKKLTLEEIYEEFWDFIDENNKIFKDFTKNDLRRNYGTSNY